MDSLRGKSRNSSLRKRKRTSTENGRSKNEPKPKRAKTEVSYKTKEKNYRTAYENSSALIANTREIRIILDKSIVDKYFRVKQMLHEILSPNPVNVDLRSDEKSKRSKKHTNLMDYLQVKNDPYNFSSPNEIENPSDKVICQNLSIKKEPLEQTPFATADVDQNNAATFDVNMPRIVYYTGSDQSNCFLYNDNLVIMPVNSQFTPEEFIYNNCGFVSVMEEPIKTEFPEESMVKEELDETNSSLTIHEHTISDIASIDENVTTSTPAIKTALNKHKIFSCDEAEETKQTAVKFNKQGFPVCPKCDRHFKRPEAFKQHILLCGVELLYECLHCEYSTKFIYAMKKHVERMHKKEIEDEGLEEIMKKIRDKRMDKKNLSLMSKETEVDSEIEETVMKSIENITSIHSKLKFDLFCPDCEKPFKRMRGVPMKMCPSCRVTLKFKCQTCENVFSLYDEVYRHTIRCIKDTFFKCKLCPFETLYEQNFKRHERTLHGVNQTINVDS